MARAILITGTDTGVGKTTVACALAFASFARNRRTGVFKPAETGCTQGPDGLLASDALILKTAASSPLPLELICPYRYATPLAPAAAAQLEGLPPPDVARLVDCFEVIAAASDVVIVESAGGLAVPLTWDTNFADLAQTLELEMVLVVPNRLGSLNHAVLSLEYATRKGLWVCGYILNDAEPAHSPAAATNADSLARLTDVPCLGTVKHRQPLPLELVERILKRPC